MCAKGKKSKHLPETKKKTCIEWTRSDRRECPFTHHRHHRPTKSLKQYTHTLNQSSKEDERTFPSFAVAKLIYLFIFIFLVTVHWLCDVLFYFCLMMRYASVIIKSLTPLPSSSSNKRNQEMTSTLFSPWSNTTWNISHALDDISDAISYNVCLFVVRYQQRLINERMNNLCFAIRKKKISIWPLFFLLRASEKTWNAE